MDFNVANLSYNHTCFAMYAYNTGHRRLYHFVEGAIGTLWEIFCLWPPYTPYHQRFEYRTMEVVSIISSNTSKRTNQSQSQRPDPKSIDRTFAGRSVCRIGPNRFDSIPVIYHFIDCDMISIKDYAIVRPKYGFGYICTIFRWTSEVSRVRRVFFQVRKHFRVFWM